MTWKLRGQRSRRPKGKSLTKKGLLDDEEFLDIVREVIPDKVG